VYKQDTVIRPQSSVSKYSNENYSSKQQTMKVSQEWIMRMQSRTCDDVHLCLALENYRDDLGDLWIAATSHLCLAVANQTCR